MLSIHVFKRGRALRIAVGISMLVLVLAGGAGAATPISDCTTISLPGEYFLNQNIINNSALSCINITSSDVIFDGAGYTIDGLDTPGTIGVYGFNSTNSLLNVTVKNLIIKEWGAGISYNNIENGIIANNIAILNWQYGIVLYSSNSNIITNNNASSSIGNGFSLYGIGIYLSGSNNNTLANNIANLNGNGTTLLGWGIGLSSSSRNTLINNVANLNGEGIVLGDYSVNNYLANNNASLNSEGIALVSYSDNNTLTNNVAYSNSNTGIYLGSNSNIIVGNNASYNNIYGINLYSTTNNTLYNNYFNNIDDFEYWDTIYSNNWNAAKTFSTNIIGGPYLGGNFWSSPDGTGFSQTCADTDRDGICDSAYVLDANNTDYLPLAASASIPIQSPVNWTKYSGNPLNLEDGANAPSVIIDGSNYKMWYALNSEIYFATSADGITWTKYGKVLSKGAPGSWEETGINPQTVILDSSVYKMWYDGYSATSQYSRIGYATSPDGITWTKYSSNPVVSPGGNGGWDDWSLSDASVIIDGTAYKMWYAAQGVQYGTSKIGYAESSDGITWTKYSSNPVLNPGGNGGWDDKHVYHQTVLKDNAGYKMWYIGLESSDIGRIGYATSPDGTTWTKYSSNPLLNLGSSGAWDDANLNGPFVLFDGNSYDMWYGGYDGAIWRIGFASSSVLSNSGGGIWQYSKDLTILNPGAALTDYQVPVNITGIGFPTGVNTSGADIRFTDAGGAELAYWMENWDYAGRSAGMWVNVTSVPAGASSMRMWYGNPSASSSSNGDATFDLYDDFTGASLDVNKWNSSGTISVSNGELSLYGLSCIKSKVEFGENIIEEARSKAGGGVGYYIGFRNDVVTKYITVRGSNGADPFHWDTSDGITLHGSNDFDQIAPYDTAYHLWKLEKNGIISAKIFQDGNLKYNLNQDLPSASGLKAFFMGGEYPTGTYYYTYVDWVRIRKYASPEPFISYNLTGRILNAFTGLGISGASVKIDAYPQFNATTNITGDYSMSVPGGKHNIIASFEPTYYANITTVSIESSDVVAQDIELVMKPRGTITGSVTNV